MKVELECTYCAFKWMENIYNQSSLAGKICPKCKDKNLKARDIESKTNYYEGAPEFPVKLEIDNSWGNLVPDSNWDGGD